MIGCNNDDDHSCDNEDDHSSVGNNEDDIVPLLNQIFSQCYNSIPRGNKTLRF